jgi:hypothetical protein
MMTEMRQDVREDLENRIRLWLSRASKMTGALSQVELDVQVIAGEHALDPERLVRIIAAFVNEHSPLNSEVA